jgi:hypothetical protein
VGEYDATGAAIEETVWLGDTPVAVVRPAAGGDVNGTRILIHVRLRSEIQI